MKGHLVRITCFLQLTSDAGVRTVDTYIEELRALRDAGFDRVWTPQLHFDPDLVTILAVAFREVPDIEVGTGVLPIQIAHPTLMAQRALTLNIISGGRLLLGLGVSHRIVTEDMWGVPYRNNVQRLNEHLDGLLPLLNGEPAEALGETLRTVVELRIPAVTPPPVYVAALGPRMLTLAGRRTAGTFTWMTGPKTLAQHTGPTLRAAAEAAGRPPTAVRVVSALPVAVTNHIDSARAEAAQRFALYGSLPSYRTMLDREGYAEPADAAMIGPEDVVVARIDQLRQAGVDELAAIPFSADSETRSRTLALLRTMNN